MAMVHVRCRTNLDDVMQSEQWPEHMDFRPVVGDKIQSRTAWGSGFFHLEMRVTETTIKYCKQYGWYLEVYLDVPRPGMSVSEFQNWYAYVRGKIGQETYSRRQSEIDKRKS